MLPKISARTHIAPFMVMDVLRAAEAKMRAGGDVLHLEAGQPSSPAPAAVREAAVQAIRSDKIGYTDALGIPALRERIALHMETTYGVVVGPERIAVTMGSSAGFILSFLACFEAGQRVAMVVPGYPAYRHILTALDVQTLVLQAGPEHRFQPTVELLDTLQGPVHGLIVASPSNPAGTMVDDAHMASLAAWCRARGAWLISDELYHGITYGQAGVTALRHEPEAVVINSFSKYFCMTGWRLGWLVLPERLVRPVERLAQNLFISPPTVSQLAALHAFDAKAELDGHVQHYARNRAWLLDALPRLGLDQLAPVDGAFYLYAHVGHLTDDSVAWCARLLDETGVALTPGVDFDPMQGHLWVRWSFAGAHEDLVEAVRRLAAWLPTSAA